MPYKIFIGNNPLYLCTNGYVLPSLEALDLATKNLRQEYYIDQKQLLKVIERLENKNYEIACVIYHHNEIELCNAFTSLFRIVEAAGGLVENNNGEVLMIYRKNKWDLPKGKIELHEEKIKAAEREVKEETGINNFAVETLINFYVWKQEFTTHAYWESQKRILKNTYWFKMKSADDAPFIPQLEEGITEVKWIKQNQVSELLKNSFASVADVMRYSKV